MQWLADSILSIAAVAIIIRIAGLILLVGLIHDRVAYFILLARSIYAVNYYSTVIIFVAWTASCLYSARLKRPRIN